MSQSSEQTPSDTPDDYESAVQPDPAMEADIPVLEAPEQETDQSSLPPRRAKASPSSASVIGVRIGEPVVRLDAKGSSGGEEEAEQAPLKLEVEASREAKKPGKDVVKITDAIPSPKDSPYQPLPTMTPLVSQASAETMASHEWGHATHHSYRWLWWGGGLVALVVLISLLIQPLLSLRHGIETVSYYDTLSLEDRPIDTNEATVYFTTNLEVVDRQSREALTVYARARSFKDALPVIRNASSLAPVLEKEWQPWNVPGDWTPDPDVVLGYASVGDLPYAFIEGNLPGAGHYAVFFVREGERMLVDWEATVAHGSVPFEKLSDPTVLTATHRGTVLPIAYYTSAFPESTYNAYRFENNANTPHVWVYAKKGTTATEALNELFHTGYILEQIDIPQQVKLKLKRGAADALPNQWEIVDVLHKGWVSP